MVIDNVYHPQQPGSDAMVLDALDWLSAFNSPDQLQAAIVQESVRAVVGQEINELYDNVTEYANRGWCAVKPSDRKQIQADKDALEWNNKKRILIGTLFIIGGIANRYFQWNVLFPTLVMCELLLLAGAFSYLMFQWIDLTKDSDFLYLYNSIDTCKKSFFAQNIGICQKALSPSQFSSVEEMIDQFSQIGQIDPQDFKDKIARTQQIFKEEEEFVSRENLIEIKRVENATTPFFIKLIKVVESDLMQRIQKRKEKIDQKHRVLWKLYDLQLLAERDLPKLEALRAEAVSAR